MNATASIRAALASKHAGATPTIHLPGPNRHLRIGDCCAAWRAAKRAPPGRTYACGLSSPGPTTREKILREYADGVNDRVNLRGGLPRDRVRRAPCGPHDGHRRHPLFVLASLVNDRRGIERSCAEDVLDTWVDDHLGGGGPSGHTIVTVGIRERTVRVKAGRLTLARSGRRRLARAWTR